MQSDRRNRSKSCTRRLRPITSNKEASGFVLPICFESLTGVGTASAFLFSILPMVYGSYREKGPVDSSQIGPSVDGLLEPKTFYVLSSSTLEIPFWD